MISGRGFIRMMTVCQRSPHTCPFISTEGGLQRCLRSAWQWPSYSFSSGQANSTPLFPWFLEVLISRALLPRDSNSVQGGRYLISAAITRAAHSSWVSVRKDQEPCCRSWARGFNKASTEGKGWRELVASCPGLGDRAREEEEERSSIRLHPRLL